MIKRIFLISFFVGMCSIMLPAQSLNGVDTTLNGKVSDKLYRFKLRKPAQCIDKSKFQKTGLPCNSYLSDDGLEIYIQNYIYGSTLYFEVTYRTGEHDVYVKSPCSLEMFLPL